MNAKNINVTSQKALPSDEYNKDYNKVDKAGLSGGGGGVVL